MDVHVIRDIPRPPLDLMQEFLAFDTARIDTGNTPLKMRVEEGWYPGSM
jgi:hypothetical protein